MAETKKGFHYAWVIFIGCALLAAGSLAMTIQLLGIFMRPVIMTTGIGPGDFALWATMSGVSSIFFIAIWGQLFKKHMKLVLILGALCLVACMLLLSFLGSTQNPMVLVIISGLLLGIGLPSVYNLAIPTLIGNWFTAKHRGKILGFTAAFSGVGTFIWSPMYTAIILATNLQVALIVNACLVAVFTLPFCIFFAKYSPEDKGLKPWGYVEGEEETAREDSQAEGMSAIKAFGTVAFWLMLLACGLVTIGMGFNSNMPAIGAELVGAGMPEESIAWLGATMVSVAAIGNLTGKIIYGWLCDVIKIKAATYIMMVLFLCCFPLWLFIPSVPTMLIGAYCLGSHSSLAAVGFPLIIRKLFGNRDYPKIYGRIMTVVGLVSGFAAAIIAYVYQLSGSYVNALIASLGIVVIVIILVGIAMNYIGKIKWEKEA